MKLVFFTRHQRLGASTRYRSVQFFDLLRKQGHEVVQCHLFSDRYLECRSQGQRPIIEILRCYFSRLRDALFAAWAADVVIIEKELFPFLPAFTDRLVLTKKATVVYDFDDAIWHAYEARKLGPFGVPYSNKIAKIVKRCDHVIAGSHYLQTQLQIWHPGTVSHIPTTVPGRRYTGQGLETKKTTDIVWIGSMSTGKHVMALFPVLKKLNEQYGARTRLIGFSRSLINGPVPHFIDIVEWSQDTEIPMMASARVGIMPLPDEPFERGKCGFKLVQYMGIGLPTVASPIGENKHIIVDGETGLLANNEGEWYKQLSDLLTNSDQASRMAVAGHKRYQTSYCTEIAANKLGGILTDACHHIV